ncbi:MAG: AmmeMemoRadiSam system protein A [Candidatus Delongbacteria bacterium]|nr:AmmeMemoRadiSam system protein A [Candidatus Delongbacteria bacterium]
MTDYSLNDSERTTLLQLARSTIVWRLQGEPATEPTSTPNLLEHCGAFVTLNSRNTLRGCIGHIESDRPLLELVPEMALAAAFDDPRFPPLLEDELEQIVVEISVLSPLWQADSWRDFEVGSHGVLLRKGFHQAVFLPQVAPEQGWDPETTLTHLALKAGLPSDAWRGEDCRFQLFTALVFSE